MFGYSKIKVSMIMAIVVLGFVFALPNFLPESFLKQLYFFISRNIHFFYCHLIFNIYIIDV